MSKQIILDEVLMNQWLFSTETTTLEAAFTKTSKCGKYVAMILPADDIAVLKGWIRNLKIKFDPELNMNGAVYKIQIGALDLHVAEFTNNNLIPFDSVLPFGIHKYHKSELLIIVPKENIADSNQKFKLTITVEMTNTLCPLKEDIYYAMKWGVVNVLTTKGDQLKQNYLICMYGMVGIQTQISDLPMFQKWDMTFT